MPMITNNAQWNAIIPMLMANAVDDVVDQALELLKKYVEDIVYSYSPKSDIYDRSMEFLDSWGKIKSVITMKTVTMEFGYIPEKMNSNPISFQHGSKFWDGGEDSRDFLADFIFKGVTADKSLFGEIPARDAWTPFKAEFDANWTMWWKTALAKQGL